jgi:hypothetical protein
MRACTWCKEGFELVERGGHLTCPECRSFLVRRGEPGWDEAFGSAIKADEYWMSPYFGKADDGPLVQIQPAKSGIIQP